LALWGNECFIALPFPICHAGTSSLFADLVEKETFLADLRYCVDPIRVLAREV
jgi:hypothetical protein